MRHGTKREAAYHRGHRLRVPGLAASPIGHRQVRGVLPPDRQQRGQALSAVAVPVLAVAVVRFKTPIHMDEPPSDLLPPGLSRRIPVIRPSLPEQPLPTVDLAAVSDSHDQHEVLIVLDGVHDPVVADADSIVVPPGELRSSWRSGSFARPSIAAADTAAERVVQTPKRACCLGVQANFVRVLGWWPYVWTSDHGRAVSRSSRACRAARLSSR